MGLFCGNCGTKLKGGKFCTECGAPIEPSASAGNAENATQLSGNLDGMGGINGCNTMRVDSPNPNYGSGSVNQSPMMGMMPVLQAAPSKKETQQLEKHDLLQGRWRFLKPRTETPPEELVYDEMYIEIDDVQYKVVKDGQIVDEGTLVQDGSYIKSDKGRIYVFNSMWTTNVYGDDMAADADACYVDLKRVHGDPKTEFDRIMNGEFESIDIVRTDSEGHAKYQIFIENNRTYMSVYKDRHGLLLEDDIRDAMCADIKEIFEKSSLYTIEQSTSMPGSGAMWDCFCMIYKVKSGMTFSLKFRGEVPEEAERVAGAVVELYDRHNLKIYAKPVPDMEAIAGTWTDERGGVKLEISADGAYRLNDEVGTFTIEGKSLLPLEFVGGWDLYGHMNRYESFKGPNTIELSAGGLTGYIFVHDYGNIPVPLHRC